MSGVVALLDLALPLPTGEAMFRLGIEFVSLRMFMWLLLLYMLLWRETGFILSATGTAYPPPELMKFSACRGYVSLSFIFITLSR